MCIAYIHKLEYEVYKIFLFLLFFTHQIKQAYKWILDQIRTSNKISNKIFIEFDMIVKEINKILIKNNKIFIKINKTLMIINRNRIDFKLLILEGIDFEMLLAEVKNFEKLLAEVEQQINI